MRRAYQDDLGRAQGGSIPKWQFNLLGQRFLRRKWIISFMLASKGCRDACSGDLGAKPPVRLGCSGLAGPSLACAGKHVAYLIGI